MIAQNFDFMVVGASFTGLSVAKQLAKAGRSVVVLEKQPAIAQRLHTTGIFTKEAFAAHPLPDHRIKPINQVHLYNADLKKTQLHSPDYFFYATDTRAVLQDMAESARAAGAVIVCDQTVLSGEQHSDYVAVSTKSYHLKGAVVLGCDGALSKTARIFGLSENEHFLIGAEYEYRAASADPAMHVFIDRKFAPGYVAWVLPGPNGITQVGLAGNKGFQPDLDGWLQKIQELFPFDAANIVEKRGGWIPAGGKLRRIHHHRVLLLGDAAGITSPLTAGGIYYGLHHGAIIGKALAQSNATDIPILLPELAKSLPSFWHKRILRQIFELPVTDKIIGWGIQSGSIDFLAQKIFFHQFSTHSPHR